MPTPPIRQIFLPNYKLNITVPAEFSDDQIADAIQRSKAQIQQASPVFAQVQRYLRNGLGPDDAGNGLQTPGLGITEQQAREQGVGPAVQSAQDAAQYNQADQAALLRHYAAVKAINSANQHANAVQVAAQAQENLLPADRLTAIGDRATRSLSNVVNTPLLNHVLDYGAPGASQQLEQMQGYGAGVARGILGFSSPASLGAMALLGPVAAEPMGAKMLLGAFGARAATGAYQRAQSGDMGGALGELTAFGLPFALHIGGLAQEAKNAADYRAGARWMDENYGIDADPPAQLLLPPGPAPNVYEAEFRPDRPMPPSTPDFALPSGRPAYDSQIASALPGDGFVADPTGSAIRQTLRPVIPTSYGRETINPPSDLVSSRYSSSDYSGPELDTQDGGMVRYRATVQTSPESAVPAASSVLATAPPIVPPPNAPTVPLAITSGDKQAISVLLGERRPFSTETEQLFADGRTKADVPLTLPQLTSLHSMAEQMVSLPNEGSDPYNHASLLKRITVAIRDFPRVSEIGAVLPQASDGAPVFREPLNSTSPRGSLTSVQPTRLNPTVQKRALIDTLRGRNDDRLILAQATDSADSPGSATIEAEGPIPLKIGSGINSGYDDGTHFLRLTHAYRKIDEVAGDVQKHLLRAQEEQFGDWQNASFNMSPEETDALFDSLPIPRLDVKETLANGQLSVRWFRRYVQHSLHEYPHCRTPLHNVLQGETLERARYAFRDVPQVLQSPVVMREIPADEIFGTITPDDLSPSGWQISINGRLFHDAEDMIFLIAEEAEHIAQRLRGMEFDYRPKYNDRLHEKLAKEMAFKITGRPEKSYQHFVGRKPQLEIVRQLPREDPP